MKRIMFMLILVAIFLFPITGIEAMSYKVEKGDCLIGIGKKVGVPWRQIAEENNLTKSNKYLLIPGQVLKISEQSTGKQKEVWKNHGADRYDTSFVLSAKKAVTAIKDFKEMPEQIKRFAIGKVLNGMWTQADLLIGDELVEMHSGSRIMKNVVVETSKEPALVCNVVFEGKRYFIYDPLICHNLCWRVEDILKPTMPVLTTIGKKQGPILSISDKLGNEPTPMAITEKEDKSSLSFDDEFEAIAFADKYYGVKNGIGINTDVQGEMWGVKLTYYIFKYTPDDGATVVKFGVYGGYSEGEGEEFDYEYDWHQFELGLATKINTMDWDAGANLGFAWRRTKGWEEKYSSNQYDKGIALSAYYNNDARRNAKKKWFPEYALQLNGLWALDTNQSHNWDGISLDPKPYDISWVKLNYRQGIYDFYFANQNSRITPHWNTGLGFEWGEDAYYLQFGFGLMWNWRGEDILTFDLMNYKLKQGANNDGWDNFLCINLSGIGRAYRGSQFKVETKVEPLVVPESVVKEAEKIQDASRLAEIQKQEQKEYLENVLEKIIKRKVS